MSEFSTAPMNYAMIALGKIDVPSALLSDREKRLICLLEKISAAKSGDVESMVKHASNYMEVFGK